ncbi:hypothetical protein HOG98_01545 [bacterium]|jgi:hypothetical protein|nr:hypothetical protein [bacterium]
MNKIIAITPLKNPVQHNFDLTPIFDTHTPSLFPLLKSILKIAIFLTPLYRSSNVQNRSSNVQKKQIQIIKNAFSHSKTSYTDPNSLYILSNCYNNGYHCLTPPPYYKNSPDSPPALAWADIYGKSITYSARFFDMPIDLQAGVVRHECSHLSNQTTFKQLTHLENTLYQIRKESQDLIDYRIQINKVIDPQIDSLIFKYIDPIKRIVLNEATTNHVARKLVMQLNLKSLPEKKANALLISRLAQPWIFDENIEAASSQRLHKFEKIMETLSFLSEFKQEDQRSLFNTTEEALELEMNKELASFLFSGPGGILFKKNLSDRYNLAASIKDESMEIDDYCTKLITDAKTIKTKSTKTKNSRKKRTKSGSGEKTGSDEK